MADEELQKEVGQGLALQGGKYEWKGHWREKNLKAIGSH